MVEKCQAKKKFSSAFYFFVLFYFNQSVANVVVPSIYSEMCVYACVSQDHSLLSVGGQPGGDAEDAVSERAAEWPAQVDPESRDRRDRQEGDVRTRDWAVLKGGGVRPDGEGHAHPGHSARWRIQKIRRLDSLIIYM